MLQIVARDLRRRMDCRGGERDLQGGEGKHLPKSSF